MLLAVPVAMLVPVPVTNSSTATDASGSAVQEGAGAARAGQVG